MTDPTVHPNADEPGNGGEAARRSSGAPDAPPPRRSGWRRLAKWLGGIVLALVLCRRSASG